MSKECLARYPDTLESDMKLMSDKPSWESLSFNHQNCVLFRVGEKEILTFFVEFAEYTLNVLHCELKIAKTQIANLPKYFDTARDYFIHQILPLMQSNAEAQ